MKRALRRPFATAAVVWLTLASGRPGQAAGFIVSVPGIPGPYCAYGAEKRLLKLSGVRNIEIRWQSEQIVISLADASAVTVADIERAMKASDYPYNFTITASP